MSTNKTPATSSTEPIDILRQGVEVWNAWRRSDRRPRPDLIGADLRDRNLRGADLRGALLVQARLSEAKLDDADLSGADLRGATLDSAVLQGTDLRNAVLENAFAFNTKFSGDLRVEGADFTNVPLRGDALKTLCAAASGTNPVTGRATRDTLECG